VMSNEPEQTTPPSDQPEGQTAETPEYREISHGELKEILEQHRKWVETGEKEGEQASLDNANLQKAFLWKANLQKAGLGHTNLQETHLGLANLRKAELGGANLQKANLIGANLQKAFLCKANLQKAAFNGTNLREANLQDADLTDATGLLAGQLAGANVSGAELPEDIAKFDGLVYVEEISKKAGKLFISMLLGCVYAWLTIATTTDVALLTNSSSSPLPVIQAKIPIAGFYWAAPLILFSLFVWFHFYLQRFWEGLAELPAIFPDGKPLDKKAYPWLLNCLVRPHFTLLRTPRPPLSRLMVGISIILAWWVVPLTFVFFWLRYLPRHHWEGTIEHSLLLVVACVFAGWSQGLAKKTLRGQERPSLDLAKNWMSRKLWTSLGQRSWKMAFLGLGVVLFTVVVSDGAINGVSPLQAELNKERAEQEQTAEEKQAAEKNKKSEEKQDGPLTQVRAWYQARIPDFLTSLPLIQARAFANFKEQEVSTRPANWFLNLDVELVRIVTGAQLQEENLRGVNAEQAFLMKADLRGANLTEANLRNANLEKANLERAHLEEANLRGAHLEEANLYLAHLEKAMLGQAHLEEANLRGAHLEEANLYLAHLEEANLSNAHLQKAILAGAHLEAADLSNAHLQKAILEAANLEQANLYGANLQEASLAEANLQQANLGFANLNGAKKLTQAQLNQACVDELTKLPKGLTRPKPCSKEELRRIL